MIDRTGAQCFQTCGVRGDGAVPGPAEEAVAGTAEEEAAGTAEEEAGTAGIAGEAAAGIADIEGAAAAATTRWGEYKKTSHQSLEEHPEE